MSEVLQGSSEQGGYPPGETLETRVASFRNGPLAPMFDTVHAKAYEKGGYFAPWENPEAIVEGLRDSFRNLRHTG